MKYSKSMMSRSKNMADRQAFVTQEDSNPSLLRRGRLLTANNYISRFPRWRRHICFTFVRTTRLSMGTSGGANAAITFLLLNDWDVGFDEEGLVDLVLAVASSRMAKPDRIALF
jgi:hypothetical protein